MNVMLIYVLYSNYVIIFVCLFCFFINLFFFFVDFVFCIMLFFVFDFFDRIFIDEELEELRQEVNRNIGVGRGIELKGDGKGVGSGEEVR